jgi:hypothetical protein
LKTLIGVSVFLVAMSAFVLWHAKQQRPVDPFLLVCATPNGLAPIGPTYQTEPNNQKRWRLESGRRNSTYVYQPDGALCEAMAAEDMVVEP